MAERENRRATRMRHAPWVAALAGLLVVGCSQTTPPAPPKKRPNPMAAMNMGGDTGMGNPLLPNQTDPTATSYNVNTSEELAKIDNGAEGEVYFTDPDNPDKEIEGITAAFESTRSGNAWMTDYGRALRFARREGRPLLIWFHDSVISPKSGMLGEHLLHTAKFNAWCKNRVVRVMLDTGAGLDESKSGTARYSRGAINSLALKYGLKRRPALAIISPRGKFIIGMDGFSGAPQEAESIIREGVTKAEEDMRAYRAKLEPKGYRTWRSATGNMSLFAKLQRFDEAHQMVYLKEYGGRISRTKLKRFCDADVEFIRTQQEKKNARP